MAEHTPGPWTVGQYTPTPHFLAITNHSCVCDPKTMALVATCGRADDRQSQIDADLISAAPDLLAACEMLTEMCRRLGFDTPSMPGFERTAYEQGLAAIAKATGATP